MPDTPFACWKQKKRADRTRRESNAWKFFGAHLIAVAGNSGPDTPTNDNQQYTETGCATPTATPTTTPTATPIVISGTITYFSNPALPPVPGVTMTLTGTSSDSTLSDGFGNYTFSSLPSGGNYTVTPTKSALTPGSAGINTLDVIALQRHYLVIGTPLTGCRLTAADVNGIGGINTLAAPIRKPRQG